MIGWNSRTVYLLHETLYCMFFTDYSNSPYESMNLTLSGILRPLFYRTIRLLWSECTATVLPLTLMFTRVSLLRFTIIVHLYLPILALGVFILATLVHLSSIGSYLITLFNTTLSLLNPPVRQERWISSTIYTTHVLYNLES